MGRARARPGHAAPVPGAERRDLRVDVVLVATGVNADGHREVLGVKVATSETKEAWNVFFADLLLPDPLDEDDGDVEGEDEGRTNRTAR